MGYTNNKGQFLVFGTPENNNTELRSDNTSGDVSEVESGLEVTESEMDDELAKELDDKYNKEVEEEPLKEKLPACFDGLSEEAKAKQYEALDKMSNVLLDIRKYIHLINQQREPIQVCEILSQEDILLIE